MLKQDSDCFYIQQTKGALVLFYDKIEQGIYYQTQEKQNWSHEKCVYKQCFPYFYVLNDETDQIYVFCQDISGDIMLCTLKKEEWRYEIIVHFDVIMPRYIRAFWFFEDRYLLYHMIDKHMNLELLVYEKENHVGKWSLPKMISPFDCYNKFPYSIYTEGTRNIGLLYMNNLVSKKYQLNYTTYHFSNDMWGKKEIIETSRFPFIDYSFCADQNLNHFLFITQDDQTRNVIYKQNQKQGEQVKVLFQHKSVSTCLLLEVNQEIFALWTCDDLLYGTYSSDHGVSFRDIIVYEELRIVPPLKVFYQKTESKKGQKTIPYEVYLINYRGEDQLLLPNVLEQYRVLHGGSVHSDIDENQECNVCQY